MSVLSSRQVRSLGVLLLFLAGLAGAAPRPPFAIETQLVRGVYWPWEKTARHAKHADMELWEFVDHMMGRIRNEWHCNLIWFVNGPQEPARVCDLAAKHGLTVLPGTRLAGLFVHGLRSEEQLDRAVKQTVDVLGQKPALGAYVLKDEPKNLERAQLEAFRMALAEADPEHPAIAVTMTNHTEALALDSGFPVICTDIYHFGGPRSPAIPNPPRRSQQTYRGAVMALADMCQQGGKTAWSMPQAFVDVWGASWTDDQGNVVIEPGSYWHWRMSTVAETRWQIWESIRAGCKGVVFFSALLGGGDEWRPDKGEMPEKLQQAIARNKGKWPVQRERVNTGEPICLTYAGGRSTPQVLAMGEAYQALGRLETTMVRWEPTRLAVAFSGKGAAVRTFRDPNVPTKRYVVVVNDALEGEAVSEIELMLLPTVATVTDAIRGGELELVHDPVGNERLATIRLPLRPGEGTVLETTFAGPRPGLVMFDEDFAKAAVSAKLVGASRRRERRGFGMGHVWRVRREAEADGDSLVVLEGLQKHHHGSGSILLTAMRELGQGTAQVLLKIDGQCPRPESLVVQFVDKDGKAGWNKTDAYHLPIAVPANTHAIQIRLAEDAAIDRVQLWRLSIPAKK
jgi:hypothetical protein